ncbi:stage V sporulation protein AB [Desulfuribacillus alkaliarsenatis]|uniref:Stage V sporulation protein AB n=1 Tax=Desulfuribacillus alkaliarsenatis TaxID=766136 RepID=A0A1E5G6W3_9FIRM|nr:stage V sporulation protein AB [Desulfuribacillus alkaliarsenatis]OEF98484.1 hypothetical protein BHF68_02070 [Desulfuribacillus alkaliarsenatis]
MHYFMELVLGFAGGLAIGGAFAAILTVLDILPRLAQVCRASNSITKFQSALILGAFSWTLIDVLSFNLNTWLIGQVIFGLLGGVFIGLLAAGLTEVFNVLPIMGKRLKMTAYISYFVMALILGKVSGSLFYWLFHVSIK